MTLSPRVLLSAAVVLAAASLPLALRAAPASPAAAPASQPSNGKVVTLDHFYNKQVRNGKPFHYIFSDTALSGFSKFGDVWKQHGATIEELDHAPTAEDLKKTSIYIICAPNMPDKAEGGKPNYISEPAISAIEQWVKDGGVLLLMANDKNNCEFEHFNQLAERFGIHFDGNLRNTAPRPTDRPHATFIRERDKFPDNPLFNGVDMIYMKEISTITVKPPAKPLFEVEKDPKESLPGPGKDVVIATADVGKGFVFAVGDPWVYNEYIDANWPELKLPVQNHKAADNLVQMLLDKASKPQAK
jgi:unsaturated rhamnogalacturonyl hydrolase